jgi:hypothetical protein
MSFQAPSKGPSIDSDTPIDLTTVFKDSAGLRIARYIVGEYLKADRQRFAGNTTLPLARDISCSVVPLRIESSPEIRRMLEERLVFRESEPVTSEHGYLGRSGFSQTGSESLGISRECANSLHDTASSRSLANDSQPGVPFSVSPSRADQNQQGNLFANVQRLSHTSYQQRPAHPSSFRSSQIQSGPVSHPQFRHTKCQAEIDIDALFEEPYSQNQGTESPYRVESPSGRVSGGSSLQRSPQRWDDSISHPTSLPNLDKDPFQLDRTLFSGSPSLSHSAQSQTSRQSYLSDSGYFSEAPPAITPHSQQHNNNFTNHIHSSTTQQAPTIKSFLPVNKATDNAAYSQFVKHSGRSHSLHFERAGSQSRPASSHPPPHNQDNTNRDYNTQNQIHNNSLHHNTTQSSFSTHIRSDHQQLPPSPTTHQQFDFEQYPTNKNHETEMEIPTSDSASKKRKANAHAAPRPRLKKPKIDKGDKPKTDKGDRPKRAPKVKDKKPDPVSTRVTSWKLYSQ